jgi:hypothetical protein
VGAPVFIIGRRRRCARRSLRVSDGWDVQKEPEAVGFVQESKRILHVFWERPSRTPSRGSFDLDHAITRKYEWVSGSAADEPELPDRVPESATTPKLFEIL